MLKMLLDPMGGIVLTNDGHAILREIEVAHPAAKSMIELSRTQDEEVGDGTTTVIILGTIITIYTNISDRLQLARSLHTPFRNWNETSIQLSSSRPLRERWQTLWQLYKKFHARSIRLMTRR